MEVILIRHGEPRYDEVDGDTRGDFGRLTARAKAITDIYAVSRAYGSVRNS